MLIKKYIAAASNVFAENRLYKFIVFSLSMIIIFLIYQNNHIANSYKVILVPPNLNQKISVYNDMIDPKYAEAMGFYVANLLYSFNNKNIDNQYDILFSMFSPDVNKDLVDSIKTAKIKYKENNIDSVLRIESIQIDSSAKIIKVSGKLIKSVFDKPLPEQHLDMNIYYKIENGLFYITNLGRKEN